MLPVPDESLFSNPVHIQTLAHLLDKYEIRYLISDASSSNALQIILHFKFQGLGYKAGMGWDVIMRAREPLPSMPESSAHMYAACPCAAGVQFRGCLEHAELS